jgi:hypothetical protein
MSDEEISALLGDDPADVVICGGSHVPFDRMVAGVRVINVGSVGEAPSIGDDAFGGEAHPRWPTHADATFLDTGDLGKRGQGRVTVEQFVVPLGKAA